MTVTVCFVIPPLFTPAKVVLCEFQLQDMTGQMKTSLRLKVYYQTMLIFLLGKISLDYTTFTVTFLSFKVTCMLVLFPTLGKEYFPKILVSSCS